jgi:hypothetical protein
MRMHTTDYDKECYKATDGDAKTADKQIICRFTM